ncbi:MAG: DNA polymerase III subunit alpha [Gammaproteobacteria bacterium]|nr:DNA polymerase III subunit alpha [Gammaproteobacteria bacterium]
MKPQFIHLRVHSEYSLSDGIVRVAPLIDRCVEQKMPAAALTDANNLFALIKFYSQAEANGIKPIVACDVLIMDDDDEDLTTLVLIAKNDIGYRHLSQLVSRSYSETCNKHIPSVSRQWLKEKSEGLIGLSGGREGDIGKALLGGNLQAAADKLNFWSSIFPNSFYLELQRTGREYEEEYNQLALDLADQKKCPVVATNDVRFLDREEFEAHEVRVCIHEGRALDDSRRERRYSQEQYLKSTEEMLALFSDIPEAIENAIEIGKRCNVNIDLGSCSFPDYPVPEGETPGSFLEKRARKGLEKRLRKIFHDFPEKNKLGSDYEKRLCFELDTINQMGFADYFLVVMEFISWAKSNKIPVGPGRGSGAGSLVAYSLEITDIDPLEYDLLFERFLNPERVSLPDFDIDFCIEGRDLVIQHVVERYGQGSVSQIITFGTMAAKAVVRDVARVQGKPYALADKLSKLIPFEPGMTLAKAVEQEPLLRDFIAADEDADEIMEMAYKLEGLTRNVGRHAGGVVIAPTDLTDFTPTYRDELGGGLMTQFDMVDVEKAGLVKFDFLGLKTLTIIDNAVREINKIKMKDGDPLLEIEEINLECEQVYRDLQNARSAAVFQLESRGMRELMKKVKPSCFTDIVALVALFRPGPMQLSEDFINRKHGREKVDYLHPSLEHILKDTYGVMLYQEQVMQIAQILAGYSLAEADLLRRAMGKKKREEMAEQKENFLLGAQRNGVHRKQADYIFGLMEKFAGYGFNKPHSVAYAMIAYQTAWLKHFYSAHFMASVLSSEMQNTDRILLNIEECRTLDISVRPPDINSGEYRFIAESDNSIVYGLGAIKGLGEGSIESLIEVRSKGGIFVDLFDFFERVDNKKVNRRSIEALINSGTLDNLLTDVPENVPDKTGYRRAALAMIQDDAIRLSEQQSLDKDAGHTDLFLGDDMSSGKAVYVLNPEEVINSISLRKRLEKEKESLGLFLTGHPVDEYREEIMNITDSNIGDLRPLSKEIIVGGQIVEKRLTKNRRGESLAFIMLDDKTGRAEVSIFSDLFNSVSEKINRDDVVFVKGSVSEDDFSGGMRIKAVQVFSIEEMRNRCSTGLIIDIHEDKLSECLANDLRSLLTPYRLDCDEGCPVIARFSKKGLKGEIAFGSSWRVDLRDPLLKELRENFGEDSVNLEYK